MKKLVFLSLTAMSLTLFSFKTKTEKVFELQENGNYKIAKGSKISQEDIDFILNETKELEGAGVFRTIKFFKTKVTSSSVSETITKDTQDDCGCPDDPKTPTDDTIQQLIQKYNN
ncbi:MULTISPECIES: hypothetical protein [Flavobacterium]|uniref:Uncharacterized protein n=1 Tax=Flavobacterium jumunjinense TaxID=998845 RepID=A0ABV5GQK0_9FLAO|nr:MULTISPECIES: hypothetical protein [Flavobacterium]